MTRAEHRPRATAPRSAGAAVRAIIIIRTLP